VRHVFLRKLGAIVLGASILACCSLKGGHRSATTSPTDKATPPTLLTSGERGVFVVSEDGEAHQLTATAALQARRHANGDIFFLHNAGTVIELRRLKNRQERVVATVPVNWQLGDSSCTANAIQSGVPLAIQDETGFFINPSGTHACLSLMDRNINMLELAVHASIDLENGQVASRLQYSEGCDIAKISENDVCSHAARTPTVTSDTGVKRKWKFDKGRLRNQKSASNDVELCTETAFADGTCGVESTSPSGRWIAVSIRTGDGDYIHRAIVLADLNTGDVVAIDSNGNLEAGHQLPPCVETTTCVDIVGETPVHWFPDSDQFSIDDNLIDLRTKRIRKLPGAPSP
jgi:hypothetical protein